MENMIGVLRNKYMKRIKYISAFIAFILVLSGCGTSPVTEASYTDKPTATSAEEIVVNVTASSTTETTKEAEPVKFNPHVHTNLLSEYVTEDMWESLYNLIDAARAGEDTFKCTDKKAYDWCTNDAVIGSFFPAACTIVQGGGFSDGIGKIKYPKGKDKFLDKEKAFEAEIERMLNESIRSDYSDFEKTFGIYLYMCKNYQYDYSSIDGCTVDDFSTYACLMTKKGICCELADAYAYMLLQAGVEAVTVEGDGDAGYHDWTFVELGGKGYFVDLTWDVYGDNPNNVPGMRYFLMTEEERLADGFTKESLKVDQLRIWDIKYNSEKFAANDKMFASFRPVSVLVNWDCENNVVIFSSDTEENATIKYGDL